MNNLKFLCLIMLALVMGACKDDTFNGLTDYSEGEPATINLSIKVPQEVVVSRAFDPDFESRINQLVLIGFEKTSGRKIFHNLTDLIKSENTPTGNDLRTYTLQSEVETLSGIYDLYLIANWQSEYGSQTLAKLEAMSREELDALVFANDNNRTELYGDYGFPMTGKVADFQIQPSPSTNKLSNVYMTRTSAHIEFRFKMGAGQDGNVPNFTPNSYRVYRLPKQAKGFEDAVEIASATFDSPAVNITEIGDPDKDGYSAAFDFYMLENRPQKGEGIGTPTTQAEREAWTGNTGSDYANRQFTNAPAGATFVVIQGEYSGPAGKDADGKYSSTPYYGTVRYIVHLGNIGNAADGYKYDNFEVNRNEYHKYNITVNGANSILVNVDVEGGNSNPGMEGYLNEQPIAELDAHYAKVMLQINKTSIFRSSETAENAQNHVVLTTAVNGFNDIDINCSDLTDAQDYKWVQFQNPGADWETTFPTYAGINADGTCANVDGRSWCYINELVAELADYMEAYHNKTTLPTLRYAYTTDNASYFYVAAFVDENIYTNNSSLAIKDWAGQDHQPRVMTLNPIERKVSANGQNTYAKGSAFNIHQKPVVSTYSLNPANAPADMQATYNPFGFEQVMEKTNTSTNVFYPSSYNWDLEENLSDGAYNEKNARAMTIDLLRSKTVNDEHKSFYKLTSNVGDYTSYEFIPTNYTNATQGIATHNRDLNGNGKIDPDEIRWYIPGLVQLYIYNFGYSVVNESLWLSQPGENDLTSNSPDQLFPRYYTSARGSQRLFWQDQRGATSGYTVGSWMAQSNNIRFARNLGNFAGSNTADITRITQHDKENKIIRVINSAICRNNKWTTAYPAHDVTSDWNLLPRAFEYGHADDMEMAKSASIAGKSYQEQVDLINSWALQQYNSATGTSNSSLPDGWRIPNQRELIALYVNNVFADYAVENMDASTKFWTNVLGDDQKWHYPTYVPETAYIDYLGYVFSCTFIETPLYKTNRPLPFSMVNGNMALPNGIGNPYSRMVLVRDVDYVTGEPLATQGSTTTSSLRKKGIVRNH